MSLWVETLRILKLNKIFSQPKIKKSKDTIVDGSEMQLFLGFLAAEGSKNDGCLYRAVCMAPENGAEYMKAGQALLEGFRMFDP